MRKSVNMMDDMRFGDTKIKADRILVPDIPECKSKNWKYWCCGRLLIVSIRCGIFKNDNLYIYRIFITDGQYFSYLILVSVAF